MVIKIEDHPGLLSLAEVDLFNLPLIVADRSSGRAAVAVHMPEHKGGGILISYLDGTTILLDKEERNNICPASYFVVYRYPVTLTNEVKK